MMSFFGRYHLVRNWWIPDGSLSEPFVLDRRDRALLPYKGNGAARAEWGPREDRRAAVRKWQCRKERAMREPTPRRQLRLAERLLGQQADCGRIAALFDQNEVICLHLLFDTGLGSATTVALSTSYVINSSGAAIAVRHLCPVGGKTLNGVYFFITSYTGTAANVNDLNLELRPEASVGAITPHLVTLTEAKTVDPASATGWIASTGWTSVLTALARNFVIVGDADGGGTDFATVTQKATIVDTSLGFNTAARFMPLVTTTGFASGNTATVNGSAKMVLAFSGGTVFGDPLTTATTPTSDTNRRGLRITTSGLVANLPIFGVLWSATGTTQSGIEIYNNANVPGTSPASTSTDLLYDNTAAGRIGCLASGGTPYTLVAGTAYRIVATYGSSGTGGPRRIDIGTGEDATLRLAMPGGGQFYFTRANGTTDWANDLVGSLPTMGLLLGGQVAASAGAPYHGAMAGGMLI